MIREHPLNKITYNAMGPNSSLRPSRNESLYHKTMKELFLKIILERNKQVKFASVEKSVKGRRIDVYCELYSGKRIAIEVQRSCLQVKDLISRTKDYNRQGIHVLWILDARGACVAERKEPKDKRNVKISPLEKFLHGMYGGRVYYVEMSKQRLSKTLTITPPFALHFSAPENTNLQDKIFRNGFSYYQMRNAHYSTIPDWNLLCTAFNGISIARFYDRNIASELKINVLAFARSSNLKNRALFKAILKSFTPKYGKIFVITTILNLIKESRLVFGGKFEQKIKRKYCRLI